MIRLARALLCCGLIGLVFPSCSTINVFPAARGKVVDARTGRPLAGAHILAGDVYEHKIVYTKADGSFRVPPRRATGIPVGPAPAATESNLFVYQSGYVTGHRRLPEPNLYGPPPEVDLGVIRLKAR